jgi:stage II sporulation protein D
MTRLLSTVLAFLVLAFVALAIPGVGLGTASSAAGMGAAASPEPSPTPTPAPVYRFKGRGSDHGVGMSQAGAVGRARAGQTFRTILEHYYRGTTVDTRRVEDRIIRVLIVEGDPPPVRSPFLVCGRGGRWTIDEVESTFPRGACANFRVIDGKSKVEILAGDGTSLYRGRGRSRTLSPATQETRLQVPSRGSRDLFRGSLHVLVGTSRARVVNHLPVGDYLRGVVPMEIGRRGPLAALKAQAVACRSVAARALRWDRPVYDVHDDWSFQVYGGATAEAPATDAAIAATAGMVVTYRGTIASTSYFAQGGGATEDARNVFTPADGSLGTDVPYLRGSLDVDEEGRPYDLGGPYDAWRTGRFTMKQLSRIMATDPMTNVGRIDRLVLRDRGVSGRLISVKLVGADGTRRKVAGWYFKSVFNAHSPEGMPLKSTLFELVPVTD